MTPKHYRLVIQDKVAHVAFNRPAKSNALHLEAWHELKAIFGALGKNPEARSIVLSGEGKNFCAGIDLSLLMGLNGQNESSCEGRKREQIREFIVMLQDCISAIEKCRKPVIAAIHRACIGGGVDIIGACDMRFCTKDAFFSIKEVDMGLVADIGTLQRLPKIITPGIMAELAYTGRRFSGEEAKEIGMVNRVFDDKQSMMNHVTSLAKDIAAKSPLVIRGIKEQLLYTRDHSVEDSLRYMATYNAAFLLSDDLKSAFEAQISQKQPTFND